NKQSDLIIASFVPALLRNQFEEFPSRTPKSELIGDHAVLLWIDICSFSPLSNRLLLDQEKGVEQLSKILQEHYDFVLNLIVKFGGEPMVFAGDGVFAAWPCKEEELFANAETVCACAQEVLANQGATDDLGNPLLLHVVAACGSCELLELGGIDGRWLYTVLGEALNDLSLTAKNREPGNILLSSAILKVLNGKYQSHPVKHNSAVLDEKVNITLQLDETPVYLQPQSISTLKSFLPSPISKKIDFDRLKWIDELRNVTIVFTQLHGTVSGSTAASGILQKAVEYITPVVVKHDGILNQVWIDEKAANILIIFGPPPSAHSDNPVRGLLTAIEVKKALSDAGFVNSVGVTSGKAFCGILGNDILRQYTVIGDVVNLGSRLAQLQLTNVCCDETTMKASRGEFTFTQPKMVIIKGLVEKEQIWELESSSIKSGNNNLEIPVIGRHNELSLFHMCFSRAQGGEGISLILEGESGLGKTKLLSSFQSLMEEDNQLVLTGSGDSVERGNPYFAWRRIFSKLMGLNLLNADQDKKETILNFLGEEFANLLSLLNILFVSDFPESEYVRSLSDQQKVDETKKLLLNLLAREAKKHTLIILIDNSIWLDEASWKLAIEVSTQIKNCFTVISVQSAEGVKYITEWKSAGAIFYQLKGLLEKDQLSLISHAFGVKHVDEEINKTLISLSKGNPFFCFELIQALIDDGSVSITDGQCKLSKGISLDKFRLPETIQGTLSRRIDSLDQGPKLALKIASVTGMRFSTELVKNIFPISNERELVPDFLSRDNKVGLLWQDMIDGSQGYTFNNAITREVAYEMLLFNQKKELHSEIARWYEVNFKHNLTPFYTRLAFHWEKAGENKLA
ncbi:MAG: AAA family ATPase, partial [Daejeonella sp.]